MIKTPFMWPRPCLAENCSTQTQDGIIGHTGQFFHGFLDFSLRWDLTLLLEVWLSHHLHQHSMSPRFLNATSLALC